MKVELSCRAQCDLWRLAAVHNHGLDIVQATHRLISNRLQIDRSPTAVRHIRRHHDFGVRVLNAAAERPSAETGVYHAVNRTDAGTGQHGCNAFDGQGHIDDDAIAFAYPQGFERIGDTVHAAQELSVGQRHLAAVLADPDESDFILAPGIDVTIQGIEGDITLRPDKPAKARIIPGKYLVPGTKPLQFSCHLGPESFVVLQRLTLGRF